MAAANPSTSIVFFLVLTLVYFTFKYYTKSESTLKMWTIIYFLVLILVQFFINLGLTSEICGSSQYGIALKTTLFPWLIVFGTINLLLFMFPAWLSPFSNTIGYLFAYITGVNGFLKSILKDRKAQNMAPGQSEMITAINNVYDDKSLLINSMTASNLPNWWESMTKGGLLKPGIGSAHYLELSNYVKMKNEIAEFIWYALSGILTTSISYNAILNSGCTKSVEEMEKRHQSYMTQEKKIAEQQKQSEAKQTVYKSYE
jgi:hypothetical protein